MIMKYFICLVSATIVQTEECYDSFCGNTVIIDDYEPHEEIRKKLSGQPVVGIDFEWDATRGGAYAPISLVQIAIPDAVFIFRIFPGDPLQDIAREIINNDNILKLGASIGNNDRIKLRRDFDVDLNLDATIDMVQVARDRGLKKPGMEGMCLSIGYDIGKPKFSSEFYTWTNYRLTCGQQRYAANDAWFLLLVAATWEVIDVDADTLATMRSSIAKATAVTSSDVGEPDCKLFCPGSGCPKL
ncbi:hypothetical protein FOL47_008461 [Perkinsus chesapeaki]|uniref:3'-5' exonuclease domain-containing protein n=1 Tax=Perkinsus chesapeaki TaxID=330153 RepID=A0A7J6LDT7_PERCH|nr:hypothetical protein FOL47_008461 [Perkinsus chesapeaki]